MTAKGSASSRTAILGIEGFVACVAGLLCWFGVSWAIRSPQVLVMDELGNLTRFLTDTYGHIFTFLPAAIYNDRPTGFILERVLYDRFGFNYTPQLCCFLTIHFSNCALAFLLLRRLGLERVLALASVGVFGVLSTTAQTATYLGAVFDVLGAFFVLTSTLAFLSEWRGAKALSAVLFFFAMRTKEFAIVLPMLFVVLTAMEMPLKPAGQFLGEAIRRLWAILLVWIIFVARYLSFVPSHHVSPDNPYLMHFDPATILTSFAYYGALVFGLENTMLGKSATIAAVALLSVLAYGITRRRIGLVFCVMAFVLLVLPVGTMPGQRSPYYAYAPQIFLLGATAFFLQDLTWWAVHSPSRRMMVTACLGLAMLGWGAWFRGSVYFVSRMYFSQTLREESTKSVEDVARVLPRVAPGSHVYVNSGSHTPWLFVAGPCAYYAVLIRDRAVSCFLGKPEAELRTLYAADTGPKYWLDYGEGGAITLGDPKTY